LNVPEVRHLASLMDGIAAPSVLDDFDVVQLSLPNGTDVFDVVAALRTHSLHGNPRAVSPNHVLIAAGPGDGCPWGPPIEYDGPIPPPLLQTVSSSIGQTPSPSITLIDSGYIDWTQQGWGSNHPLDTALRHVQPPVNPGFWPSPGGWMPCPASVPNASGSGRLDALAGHSNFVAGLLAQRCDQPNLAIWDINSSFADDDPSGIPTEAGVLCTLLRSQVERPTPVIVVTFAFCPFGDCAGDAYPGAHWDWAFTYLRVKNPDFVLVAPVGNQGETCRRYPAAFAKANPAVTVHAPFLKRDNPDIIGVASLTGPTTLGSPISAFSNRGRLASSSAAADPWVTCAAIGENVQSSFLDVDMQPEEDPMPGMAVTPFNFRKTGWATWNGTSFATPKVAAAIANLLGPNGNALGAWNALAASSTGPLDPEVGIMFDMLG
jgi:thermitase